MTESVQRERVKSTKIAGSYTPFSTQERDRAAMPPDFWGIYMAGLALQK